MRVPEDQIKLAARRFFSEQPQDRARGENRTEELPEVELRKRYSSKNNQKSELLLYLNGNGKGWVVLSDDTDLPPIYARSDGDPSEMEECPPFVMMMEAYIRDIEDILEEISRLGRKRFLRWPWNNGKKSLSLLSTINNNRETWARLFAGEITQTKLSSGAGGSLGCGHKYLIRSKWKQSDGYNNHVAQYCSDLKESDRQDYLVGCVAVAVGQIVRYLAAEKGRDITLTGAVRYDWRKGRLKISWPSTGAAPRTYRTSIMEDVIDATTLPAHKDEVSRFLKDVAIMLESDFGTAGTSSNVKSKAVGFLQKNVQGLTCKAAIDIKSTPDWWNFHREIAMNRPVLIRGTDHKPNGHAKPRGHAFIIDGYDQSILEHWHFNYGWGPGRNGWGRAWSGKYNQNMAAVLEIDMASPFWAFWPPWRPVVGKFNRFLFWILKR